MFFIGIFGIEQGQKKLGVYNNAVCPACGRLTSFEVFKSYSYFHFFFIPLFKWGTRYYVKPSCCGSVCELDEEIGRQYEKNQNVRIEDSHLHTVWRQNGKSVCSRCGSFVDPQFRYCPYCGEKLD